MELILLFLIVVGLLYSEAYDKEGEVECIHHQWSKDFNSGKFICMNCNRST